MDILDDLYEAALHPQMWPSVLERLAQMVGAKGALFFSRGRHGASWTGSAKAAEDFEAYVKAGWMHEHDRAAPLLERLHPGFLTDGGVYGAARLELMSVYRDFLIPRGYPAGAGTVIQGASQDGIILGVEGSRGRRRRQQPCRRLTKFAPTWRAP